MPDEIYECAREILATDTALLSIGGDHFVSYPLLRAHAEKHGELSLIHFDAHSDTWEEDSQRIDHGTMFYHAAQQGSFRRRTLHRSVCAPTTTATMDLTFLMHPPCTT